MEGKTSEGEIESVSKMRDEGEKERWRMTREVEEGGESLVCCAVVPRIERNERMRGMKREKETKIELFVGGGEPSVFRKGESCVSVANPRPLCKENRCCPRVIVDWKYSEGKKITSIVLKLFSICSISSE